MSLVKDPNNDLTAEKQLDHALHDVRSSIFYVGQLMTDPKFKHRLRKELPVISNASDDLATIRKYTAMMEPA